MAGLKRLIYSLPIMAGYRRWRTTKLASVSRQHPMGFCFAGGEKFFRDDWEPWERAVLIDAFRRTDVFVDIGANQGIYSCIAASADLSVVAIEPEPGNLRFLLNNIQANDYEVEVFPVALNERAGVARLYGDGDMASLIPGWGGAKAGFSILTAVNSLDNLLGDRLSGQRVFIKIDVEGVELDVLRGATKLLSRVPRPTWMIEVIPGEGFASAENSESLFAMFFKAGYRCQRIDTMEYLTIERVRAWIDHPSAGDGKTANYLFTDYSSPSGRS